MTEWNKLPLSTLVRGYCMWLFTDVDNGHPSALTVLGMGANDQTARPIAVLLLLDNDRSTDTPYRIGGELFDPRLAAMLTHVADWM